MKPGYQQTDVGVIPQEWEVKWLGCGDDQGWHARNAKLCSFRHPLYPSQRRRGRSASGSGRGCDLRAAALQPPPHPSLVCREFAREK